MGAFNRILLHRQIVIRKPADIIISKLYSNNDFKVKKLNDENYKILAKISFGVGSSGILFDGIKVYLTFTRDGENTILMFTTRLRIELIFLMLLEVIFIIILLSTGVSELSLWPLGIIPVCIIWFWAVYRYQENSLADDVEAYLK